MGWRWTGPPEKRKPRAARGGHRSEIEAKRDAVKAATGKLVADDGLVEQLFSGMHRDGWRVEIEL